MSEAMTFTYVRDLPNWCPITKLYRHNDDYIAVTVIDFWTASGTEVFLADEHGVPIDADGDPSNGLTPILRCAPGTTHEQAIAELLAAEASP